MYAMPAQITHCPFRAPLTFLLLALSPCGLRGQTADTSTVDFVRQIQPILAENCYHCHGTDPQTREGNLRLDVREAALVGGDSEVSAIVPGASAKSALIARIDPAAGDEIMPPPHSNKHLTAAEIQTLRQWIDEGAEYAVHWAFQAPQKTPVDNGSHPIDFLVDKVLAAQGLQKSAPADAATLCRRIYLDLIGLPPSPAQIDAFVAAHGQQPATAVDNLIDQLQQLPQFGEKWARHWLDIARYSDSNGFEKDLPREQWAWRDWVIDAINNDMPYDTFLIEQIAGDLLPDATQDQVIATGFLRNSMINEEGAIVAEEFRMEEMFDRMDCLGKAFFGVSLQCAQCHSHKFDPISHDEYFGLFAFFNNTYESQSWVYSEPQQKQIASIGDAIDKAIAAWKAKHPDWETEFKAWQQDVRSVDQNIAWTPLTAIETGSTGGLNHPTQEHDGIIMTQGHPTSNSGIYLIAEPTLQGVTGVRFEALPHGDLPFGGPGHSKYGTWALSELRVQVKPSGKEEWESIALASATADFSEASRRMEMEFRNGNVDDERTVGPVDYLIDGNLKTAWMADRGPGQRNQASVAVVQFAKPLDYPAGSQIKVQWEMHHGGGHNRLSTMLGCCRVSLTQAADPKAQPIDYGAVTAIREQHSSDAPLREWLAKHSDAKKLNAAIAAQWKKYPLADTSVLHLGSRRADRQRPTHLLDRGSWTSPKHVVPPGTPAFLPPLEFEARQGSVPNRLDLARWLVDRRAPLTARVAVNRIWQSIFGVGLVETPEDFGTRSPLPTHPALLDWLAVELIDNGWSRKQLVRTILRSATYQQDSAATPADVERDPNNKLLARGARFRMDAEVIRDTALTIADLLDREVGGPSIYPPVPESVLNYNYTKPSYWVPPTDSKRYRRALYLFRKRSMPDPVLSAFDAPNGDVSCARRPRSNTPLSALVSLNETVFVEAAQAMALRVLREGGPDDGTRIDFAYRLCLGRPARETERAIVLSLLEENRQRLRSGELEAGKIAFSDFTDIRSLPADATPNEIAVWAVVSRVMLNLDETLSKF